MHVIGRMHCGHCVLAAVHVRHSRKPLLGTGSRKQEAGSRKQDAGSRKQEAASRKGRHQHAGRVGMAWHGDEKKSRREEPRGPEVGVDAGAAPALI